MEQKPNYQQQLDAILARLNTHGAKPSLLLHACCAPCSSYVLEYLSQYFAITMFYYNPNIFPPEEYQRRLQELRDFLPRFSPAAQTGVALVEAPYNPEEFYAATNARAETALQTEPEKGERCRRCYQFRMERAFRYAQEHGFDYFTTTLSISPHKDSAKINEIGAAFVPVNGLQFLPADFKKRGGFLRSLQLSKEYGLYRQDYCGCVYSKQNKN